MNKIMDKSSKGVEKLFQKSSHDNIRGYFIINQLILSLFSYLSFSFAEDNSFV